MDWGSLAYLNQRGRKHRIWVFVMTMGWSRVCYVELVRKADTGRLHPVPCQRLRVPGRRAAALPLRQCQGGDPGRDEDRQPIWNRRMLDFALRVGFEIRLCQPYRAQTKGKVRKRGEVRQGQHVAQHALHRRAV